MTKTSKSCQAAMQSGAALGFGLWANEGTTLGALVTLWDAPIPWDSWKDCSQEPTGIIGRSATLQEVFYKQISEYGIYYSRTADCAEL